MDLHSLFANSSNPLESADFVPNSVAFELAFAVFPP